MAVAKRHRLKKAGRPGTKRKLMPGRNWVVNIPDSAVKARRGGYRNTKNFHDFAISPKNIETLYKQEKLLLKDLKSGHRGKLSFVYGITDGKGRVYNGEMVTRVPAHVEKKLIAASKKQTAYYRGHQAIMGSRKA